MAESMKKTISLPGLNSDPTHVSSPPPAHLVKMIQHTASNAGRALALHLAFLAYWAAIWIGTSTPHLVLDRQVFLPILGLNLPRNLFFVTAPFVAFISSTCSQFYIHRLKALVADVQLRSPQQDPGLMPWMTASVIVRQRGFFEKIQRIFMAVLLWGSLPFALTLNALAYLRTHELIWSYVLAGIAVAGTAASFIFWNRLSLTSREKFYLRKIPAYFGFAVFLAFQASIMIWMIPWGQDGLLPSRIGDSILGRYLQPMVLAHLNRVRLIPDLDQARTRNFNKIHLEGARLHHADLRQAYFQSAFFRNAKMEFADLQGVNFDSANMIQVRFNFANLDKADFTQANLIGAYILGANLRESNFRGSQSDYVRFYYSDASGADFRSANLYKSNFFRDNLQGANLQGANLHGNRLNQVNFDQANLQGADLSGADLWESTFSGANLEETNLRQAANLTLDQIAKARTLYQAQLDAELYQQVKEKYPQLLTKPKE